MIGGRFGQQLGLPEWVKNGWDFKRFGLLNSPKYSDKVPTSPITLSNMGFLTLSINNDEEI